MPVEHLRAGDLKKLHHVALMEHHAAEKARDARAVLRRAVSRLRGEGYSWTAIAEGLGMSRQGAQQRFGE